jgi:hypothetical protein
MGTFIIKPTLISGVNDGHWFRNGGGNSDAQVLLAVNNAGEILSPDALVNTTMRFTFFGDCIYLDGSATPISFNGLPAGFTPLSAALTGNIFTAGPNTHFYAQLDEFTESAEMTTDGIFTLAYDFTPPFEPSMLDIVNNGFGYRSNNSNSNNGFRGNSDPFIGGYVAGIEGTYEIQGFLFEMETPTDPIQEDTQITVTSPDDPLALDFTQVTSVTLDWLDVDGNPHSITIDPLLWILITFHIFIFRIPALPGNPPIVVVNITSTQFSGSVSLGKLITIFFENATGIYAIVPGKTNDTIYDNDNGGTIDVKIPNPVWKTGFIGG